MTPPGLPCRVNQVVSSAQEKLVWDPYYEMFISCGPSTGLLNSGFHDKTNISWRNVSLIKFYIVRWSISMSFKQLQQSVMTECSTLNPKSKCVRLAGLNHILASWTPNPGWIKMMAHQDDPIRVAHHRVNIQMFQLRIFAFKCWRNHDYFF